MDKIEEVVIKNFIRTVKDNGLLPLVVRHLRIGFPLIEFYKSRYGKSCTISSVFSSCKDTEDMAEMVRSLNKKLNFSNLDFEENDYTKVNMCVNHLIHYTLERFINQIKVQEIGEKIYYESCIELFGKVDEKEEESPNEEDNHGTPLNSQDIFDFLNSGVGDTFDWSSIYRSSPFFGTSNGMFNGGVMLGADISQNE